MAEDIEENAVYCRYVFIHQVTLAPPSIPELVISHGTHTFSYGNEELQIDRGDFLG